jgi:hypothetical protein
VVEKQFRGTREEHIALNDSLEILKANICKCNNGKEDINKPEPGNA